MTRLSGAALVGLLLAGAGLASAQDYPHAYPRDGAEQLFEQYQHLARLFAVALYRGQQTVNRGALALYAADERPNPLTACLVDVGVE